MSRYPKISGDLLKQLSFIEPSLKRSAIYYPCSAALKSEKTVDAVCFVEETSYFKNWGVWPEDDVGKRYISISDVKSVSESRYRLPARYANELYHRGESGMGAHGFTIEFMNGIKRHYLTGSLVDFIEYPEGLTDKDIYRFCGVANRQSIRSPSYSWRLFSE